MHTTYKHITQGYVIAYTQVSVKFEILTILTLENTVLLNVAL